MLSCQRVQRTGSVLCLPLHSILKRLLGCQTSPPARHIFTLRSDEVCSRRRELTLRLKPSGSNPHRSNLGKIQSEQPSVNDSGFASQGMNLRLCPFLTLKSPMGPGGCGKSEARSLLNSCVIEFPHNTSHVRMNAGTSRAQSTLG